MGIEVFGIGPLETNCYVVYQGEHAIVVDPGGDPRPVLKFLQAQNLQLAAICLTHLHFDHLYGVADLHASTKAPIYTPKEDAFLLDTESGQGGMWGFPTVKEFTSAPLTAGEHTMGGMRFIALHTPGHTPGSVSLYFPELKLVCTGDVLFYRAVGRSDLPGGDHQTLIESIKKDLFTLPPETIVYPGHGPETSIGDEIANNPFCGDFSR